MFRPEFRSPAPLYICQKGLLSLLLRICDKCPNPTCCYIYLQNVMHSLTTTNIYMLNVAALDETIISSCLHFSMQNIEQSRGLCRASRWSKCQPISFFVYQHSCDVIYVSPRRYVQDFRSLAVPTPPLQIKYFIFQG